MANLSSREQLFYDLLNQYYEAKLTRGELLHTFRKQVIKYSQSEYCKLVGIGRNSLIDIEKDRGEPSETIINKAFRPFNLKVGLVPKDISILERLFSLKT